MIRIVDQDLQDERMNRIADQDSQDERMSRIWAGLRYRPVEKRE